ncbi:MAG: hypothetical protein B6U78_00790 [Candidatus Aenigmarchaeota archaeon ex4484_224]|nr:MAG: hypothetical protein B6U78_00790 [Candidatus Aenigmarchaeota archaeon ex4484_224]
MNALAISIIIVGILLVIAYFAYYAFFQTTQTKTEEANLSKQSEELIEQEIENYVNNITEQEIEQLLTS